MATKVDDGVLQEIARLQAEGRSGNQIATALGLARGTVQRYLGVLQATNGHDPTAPAPVLEDVPLAQIRLTGETQARAELDPHTVTEYAEAMGAKVAFPPVVLFRDAEGVYHPGDGHHRIEAARQVGFTTIQAEVREGGAREAFLYACSANLTHGLRPQAADKHYAVNRLLIDEQWGGWSDREIARRCGVSHPFVGKLRAALAEQRANHDASLTGNVTSERTYTTKHGTVATMDTSRIGTHAEPPAPANGMPAQPTRPTHPPRQERPRADMPVTRRWYLLVAGLQQVIADFAHGGGLEPLLHVWTPEERTRARGELRRQREQLEHLDVALAGDDAPEGPEVLEPPAEAQA